MYRGQHRAPRVSPLALPKGTAAAAGSLALAGFAITGVAAAPGAEAASGTVWDRVAHCESTDNWHINTGNGYYGGLQFSQSTWSAYHGGKYASRADLASRLEQIEVARRVLAAQGPGAWPVCSREGGLTRENGGATSAPLPDEAGSESGAAVRSHHRRVSRRQQRINHHRYYRRHHHASGHSTSGATYRVRSGDTLARIARAHDVSGGWHQLWLRNRATVPNPNRLRVGQLLHLPA